MILTNEERAAVERLVKKWGEASQEKHPPSPFHELTDGKKIAFAECAAELSALLREPAQAVTLPTSEGFEQRFRKFLASNEWRWENDDVCTDAIVAGAIAALAPKPEGTIQAQGERQ